MTQPAASLTSGATVRVANPTDCSRLTALTTPHTVITAHRGPARALLRAGPDNLWTPPHRAYCCNGAPAARQTDQATSPPSTHSAMRLLSGKATPRIAQPGSTRRSNSELPARAGVRKAVGPVGQDPIWSPMILNGGGFGFTANHSLVMANYISRANSALRDLRMQLAQG